ncbi:winged helix-turn-helix domain-containing protein [Streptomyces zaomyceticus]|uniref:winged helix-turn-helix domain-containing protein n=1 Tax=Streptomyces zaomyceticus TaxID=68286 RepID=UPI0033B8CC5A
MSASGPVTHAAQGAVVAAPPPRRAATRLPSYRQAAADLRGQILDGRLGPGKRLPSMRELQKQYGIAGMTARSALKLLQSEGLADAVRGRGTFVAEAPSWSTAEKDTTGGERREQLESVLRDVLSHIRPQGNPGWELNTCLVSNDQLTKWWTALGATPPVADSRGGVRLNRASPAQLSLNSLPSPTGEISMSEDHISTAASLEQAIESLRQGNPLVDASLRGPLAELLQDAAEGDSEGVINPYADAVARALLHRS